MARTIVLAEDNRELRELLAAALERDGYTVVQVETGTQLIAAVGTLVVSEEAPSLIITDVRMPNASGFDAARVLRGGGLAIPMIFMTAFGDAWSASKAADFGAVLLDKPLRIEALRNAVRHVLAR